MTQKDDRLQNTEAFIAGKQDTLHMYSKLRDGYMEVTGYYILPGIYLVYNDIHTQIVANDDQGLSKDILLINYCKSVRLCESGSFCQGFPGILWYEAFGLQTRQERGTD